MAKKRPHYRMQVFLTADMQPIVRALARKNNQTIQDFMQDLLDREAAQQLTNKDMHGQ